jgi:hypothetical protein
MFQQTRLAWARVKALSVLQNAYEMPLKNPLEPLDATDLALVTAATFDAGGNEFDAAAGFMTYRIKSALQADLRLGKTIEEDVRSDIPKVAIGFSRTRNFMKFYELHMTTVREINKLAADVDAMSKLSGALN